VTPLRHVVATSRFLRNHAIAGRQPLRAHLRWFGWQAKTIARAGAVTVQWIGSTKLIAQRGMTSVSANVYTGLDEVESMAFAVHLLRPGDLFVDIGANAGVYTVLAAAVAGSRVIAAEPVSASYGALARNVAVNVIGDRVDVRRVAVGASASRKRVTSDRDATNRLLGDDESYAGASETAEVVTLDDLVGRQSPKLVKIDVEGGEYDVLHGASATLANADLDGVIVELRSRFSGVRKDAGQIDALLSRAGFAAASYDPFSRALRITRRINEADRNTIYVRSLERAQARLASAAPIDVYGQLL
jgi:FkbM family methyltransferase